MTIKKVNAKQRVSLTLLGLIVLMGSFPHAQAMDEREGGKKDLPRALYCTAEGNVNQNITTHPLPQSVMNNNYIGVVDDERVAPSMNQAEEFLSKGLIEGALIKPHKLDSSQCYRLLSLDGGGQRAEIFLPTLIAIEYLTGKKLHELYDDIGGTSTGGITALAVSYKNPKTQDPMSALDVLKMYHHCSREIFRQTTLQGIAEGLHGGAGSLLSTMSQLLEHKHAPTGLEKLAKMIVGEDRFQKDKFLTEVYITAVNKGRGDLEIFSTVDPNVKNIYIWEVLRCTSAAETYFPGIELGDGSIYIDGGHMSNHPAADIFRHIDTHRTGVMGNKNLHIYSLGTGDTRVLKNLDEVKAEGGVSKILGAIQYGFSAQEKNANEIIEGKITEFKNVRDNMRADISKSTLSYIEKYFRSQTEPLPLELHEMDNPKKTNELLEMGLKQLYHPKSLEIFKSLFEGEIEDKTLSEKLYQVDISIRNQLNKIDIKDLHEVSLLGNICSLINAKEAGKVTDQETANAFFEQALGIVIEKMGCADLENTLSWIQEMRKANKEHQGETTALQQAYSSMKSSVQGFTAHGSIDSYLNILEEKAARRITQIMRNENEDFNELLFIGESLRQVIEQYCENAKPQYFSTDQETPALNAFKKHFEKHLLLERSQNNQYYNRCLVLLVQYMINMVTAHYDGSYGATTGFRNMARSFVGLPVLKGSHTILLFHLNALREKVITSLESSNKDNHIS